MPPLLEVRGLGRSYRESAGTVRVLQDLSFALAAGEQASLIGPSGSGKSTLLHLLGLLDAPTEGAVLYRGLDTAGWSEARREEFRAGELGFVFQDHHLLPEFTLLENVLLPLARREGWSAGLAARGRDLLDRLGLAARAQAFPATLSGGERQRGAICRALLHRPALLLMDEPTGNLDPGVGLEIMRGVLAGCGRDGTACIFVTHNLELAAMAGARYAMRGHRLERIPA